MPIRPENRFFYPIDWVQLSQVIRFERAKGCCEGCGRPHGQLVCHLGDGRWWDASTQAWRSGKGRKLKLAPPEALPANTPRYTTQCIWPVPTWITTRATTRRPTSGPSASAAISCTTGRSI